MPFDAKLKVLSITLDAQLQLTRRFVEMFVIFIFLQPFFQIRSDIFQTQQYVKNGSTENG